jgi:hypothetical protein
MEGMTVSCASTTNYKDVILSTRKSRRDSFLGDNRLKSSALTNWETTSLAICSKTIGEGVLIF